MEGTVKRVEKAAVVDELKIVLAGATVAMLADPQGLTMSELTELRKQLRQQGVTLQVVKNTLARLAAAGTDLHGLTPYLVGPTAIIYGKGDPTAPAKLLAAFSKTKPTFQIKAGFAEGTVLPGPEAMALADLPSREVLAARLAGIVQSPLRGLVAVLYGPLRSLLMVLEAVRRQKG
jgi:large subunit ribosomal protein L10